MDEKRYEERLKEQERNADHNVKTPSRPVRNESTARDDHGPDYTEEGKIPTGLSGKHPKSEKR